MIKELLEKVKEYEKYKTWVPPGHYYSPIPDKQEVQKRKDEIFKIEPDIAGLDLNVEAQKELLLQCTSFYDNQPFQAKEEENKRYYFENPFFSYADGLSLYHMMRSKRPKRIIEVGSGFSSALMLDVNEMFFDNQIDLTFIEPYPERLLSLVKEGEKINLIESGVQEVDLTTFKNLKAGDFLFIDSSHVSKVGSDVNHLFFKVLPVLAPGVFIHVHDIAANFEYPERWIMEGRSWNESYMLRSFLMFNPFFQIHLFNAYLGSFHTDWLLAEMPLFMKNSGGSIWIQKLK
ncbi:MAG: class I SAM-dependent methyltransferase [Saprospiraceae bacterium]|nr:class I SAM-dependent methyltransferase [Saprospiraceae bacterium]